jgi:hypothetical protein
MIAEKVGPSEHQKDTSPDWENATLGIAEGPNCNFGRAYYICFSNILGNTPTKQGNSTPRIGNIYYPI